MSRPLPALEETTNTQTSTLQKKTGQILAGNIAEKFDGSSKDLLEEEFKKRTVGLVSAEEFRRTRDIIEKGKPPNTTKLLSPANSHSLLEKRLKVGAGQESSSMLQKRKPCAVILDDDVEPDMTPKGKGASEPKLTKPLLKLPNALPKILNPSQPVAPQGFAIQSKDSSRYFIDLEAEGQSTKNPNYLFEDDEETKRLKQEALEVDLFECQLKVKYWDRFEVVKTLRVRKETKIGFFQEICRQEYIDEYPDFKSTRGEVGFMLVVDGIILPTMVSFLELLKKDLKGASGAPLFPLVKHEDFEERLGEPAILIDKKQYEQTKHIYPMKNWIQLNLTLID